MSDSCPFEAAGAAYRKYLNAGAALIRYSFSNGPDTGLDVTNANAFGSYTPVSLRAATVQDHDWLDERLNVPVNVPVAVTGVSSIAISHEGDRFTFIMNPFP